MANESRHEGDRLDFYARLHAQPYAFDFFQTLRCLEALHPDAPRIGDALHPTEEPIRFSQEAALTFAPSSLSSFAIGEGKPSRLTVRFLGLFGPQGALPTHLTELARERLRHHGDPTFVRFADMFHHRLLSLFYKAWRQAQPTANQDRSEKDAFAKYIGATFGAAYPGANRDQIPDTAKRFFSGHLSHDPKNAEGLASILSEYFQSPVSLQPFHPRWMVLPPDQRSALTLGKNNQLGRNVVIGKRVWDAQHHFLLRAGPLGLAQYTNLLPGQHGFGHFRDWVRLYTGRQFGWQARLIMKKEEVPPLQLNGTTQLGWTTWLHKATRLADAEGALLDPESITIQEVPTKARLIRGQPLEDICLK